MKKIQKEIKTYESVYVADDGTEFKNESECRAYDESAKGVLNARLKAITVKESNEYHIFDKGCEDNPVEVLKPTADDVQTILQVFLLYNSYLTTNKTDAHDKEIEEARKLIERAISENDYLLVGRGYDYDSFWFYGTCNSIAENIREKVTPTKND